MMLALGDRSSLLNVQLEKNKLLSRDAGGGREGYATNYYTMSKVGPKSRGYFSPKK